MDRSPPRRVPFFAEAATGSCRAAAGDHRRRALGPPPATRRPRDRRARRGQVLEFAVDGRGVTCAKLRYWVAEDDGRSLKAGFFAQSQRLLKSAR